MSRIYKQSYHCNHFTEYEVYENGEYKGTEVLEYDLVIELLPLHKIIDCPLYEHLSKQYPPEHRIFEYFEDAYYYYIPLRIQMPKKPLRQS